jgi:hypothetical protein
MASSSKVKQSYCARLPTRSTARCRHSCNHRNMAARLSLLETEGKGMGFSMTVLVCPSASLNSRAVSGSSPSPRARNSFEPSSSKLHGGKGGDGEQVTGDVRSLDAPKRGGRKSRLEQIPHLL